MAVSYSSTSPYSMTPLVQNKYLDVLTYRDVPKSADDVVYTITNTYQYRPDLLAYDLYGDQNLWWVFIIRNKNTLKDPIWDFTIGTTIYLPKKTALVASMGI
jgi:Base plate wedge protein 53